MLLTKTQNLACLSTRSWAETRFAAAEKHNVLLTLPAQRKLGLLLIGLMLLSCLMLRLLGTRFS